MHHKNPIAAAAVLALLSPAAAWAQDTPTATVEVVGIRASLERSITAKREAVTNIEAITAEDVGKMPDKNIADSLSRLSGVSVTHGAALAFDEAERIQIRGTPSSLNLVTINGHSLSSGDWYLSDQNATTRAVGFGMLPSQLIGQARVYKNGQADITEGGLGGAVDVITRKPLDFRAPFTGQVALGGVHTSLANKTDLQASALLGWQNTGRTFGVLVQAFREDRSLRRDGVENFGVTTLLTQATTDPTRCLTVGGTPVCGNAELRGKRMPGNLASALFEGERQREGAFVGLQFKPNKDVDLAVTAFHSELKASNYNSNTFTFANNMLNGGAILAGTKIEGDVVTAATINPNPARITSTSPGDIAVQSGHQVRLGAGSSAAFYDFEAKLRATPTLVFDGKIGHTEGNGKTESSPGLLFRAFNKPITYKLNGGQPFDWSVADVNLGNLNQGGWRLISDIQTVFDTTDQDTYLYLNGNWDQDIGPLTRLRFGLRAGKHENRKDQIHGAWNFKRTGNGVPSQAEMDAQFPLSQLPIGTATYPSDFGAGLSGNFPRNVLRLDRDAMAGTAGLMNYDPVLNKGWDGSYIVKEDTKALYAMQEFEFGKLGGNLGVRLVKTDVTSIFYQALPNNRVCAALADVCPPQVGVPVQNAITTSRRSGYMEQQVQTSHNAVLPSLNLRWDIDRQMIARASITRTMARPEYSQLAGAVSGLNNTVTPKTANAGNPFLKPTMADNVDASLAYYFSSRAYVQGSAFAQDLKDYVKRGTATFDLKNPDTQEFEPYLVNSWRGRKARIRGAELSGEAPIGAGFGVLANATYIDAIDEDGATLIGTSRSTLNLRGYYESDKLSVSVAWNRRSDYPISYFGNGTITPPSATAARNGLNYAAAQSTLAMSINYKIDNTFSVSFDGTNLNDPVRYYYSVTKDMPLGWYKNGRQYYLTVRAKI